MQLEAMMVSSGKTIETDLCIVGAGPAGAVVAAALSIDGARDVVLLESGTEAGDEIEQRLNEGDVTGDAYAGLRATRHRGVGGTSLLWNTPVAGADGAKYVSLDPWDLEPRWPAAPDGWPVPWDELAHWYAAADALCGLSEGPYERHDDSPPLPFDLGDDVVPRLYKFGTRDHLRVRTIEVVRGAPNARLLTGATVVTLEAHAAGAVVTVARRDGERFPVRARRVVLAAGAVENARLLLLAQANGAGVVDRSGWLGCGFMEHPRDRAIALELSGGAGARSLAFLDAHASGGALVAGRLGLAGSFVRAEGALNASATLLPRIAAWRTRLRWRAGAFASSPLLDRWLPAGGAGWSSHPHPARTFEGLDVLLNLEQPPRRENAITLGSRLDAFGTPLPALHWRWCAEDQRLLSRVRATFARALERAGIGRVQIDESARPDPNAHHHAGTTRMHDDPMHGVVDATGRVHGTRALYVAGASTFPSAGFANPALTIVAMALRLAEHLRGEWPGA
jgi:choline dehydrogenase-like flavoprotein